MCGLCPYSRCLSCFFSGVAGHRFGWYSRLRMALLRPRYHFRAASECSALISPYRWARSRSARKAMLTRYAMLGFEVVEKLPRQPDLSFFRVLQPLTDAFLHIGM